MRSRPLTTLLTAAVVLAAAESAPAASTTVVRVADGDTVKLREGKRTRSVDLLGLEVPACHAAEARKALQRLLPAKSRVRVERDGTRKGSYVYRAGKLVNAALLRAGAARAATLEGLKLSSSLMAAEQAAKAAGKGLWTACPQPAPPVPPNATEQARKDLAGRVFTRITATTFSSTESRLHLCADGSFVEDVDTFSDFGDPSENPLPDSDATHQRYQGRWEVLSASYSPDVVSARVRRINQDGSEGFVDFAAQGGRVTVNGSPVSVQTSAVCT